MKSETCTSHKFTDWKTIVPGSVYTEECCLCFVSPQTNEDVPLFTCLSCHVSYCKSHLSIHQKQQPRHFTMVKSLRKDCATGDNKAEEAQESQNTQFSERVVLCSQCGWNSEKITDNEKDENYQPSEIEKYIHQLFSQKASAAEQEKIEASHLSNPKTDCPHWAALPCEPSGKIVTSSSPCVECGMMGNNWLCLSCGYVGCGREETGGHGHAKAHCAENQHHIVLKLGTINKDGTADVWCYQCDDEIIDFSLHEHLLRYGIRVQEEDRSVKTLAELEYEMNGKREFIRIVGKEDAEIISGPGLTGLRNIGNSCYIASALQVLLSTVAFHDQFYMSEFALHHSAKCTQKSPIDCLTCQWIKVAHGVLSGLFSKDQCRPSPRDFKRVACKRNSCFRTYDQQDVDEFIRFLLSELNVEEMRIRNELPVSEQRLSDMFKVLAQERQVCNKCGAVAYNPETHYTLSFQIPVEKDFSPEENEDLYVNIEKCIATRQHPDTLIRFCSRCNETVSFTTKFEILKFPRYLFLCLRRFTWSPKEMATKKLMTRIKWDKDQVNFEALRGTERNADEFVLKSGTKANQNSSTKRVAVDELMLVQLISMGFDQARAEEALRNCDNDEERALCWLLSHDEGCPEPEVTPEMPPVVDKDPVVYTLTGLISHIGPSAQSGHYVSHILKTDVGSKTQRWVQFNDEKVTMCSDPPKDMAYVYFLKRHEH